MMIPSIWIYGGFHHDPGTRQRFLKELAKQHKAPHFVAIEWEKPFFEKVIQRRPWIERHLRQHCNFLTNEDCHELSLALAWEGDAYAEIFPRADLLWLESGFQEANAKQRYGSDTDVISDSLSQGLLERLCNPCLPTMAEWQANIDPLQEPRSKKDLTERVWRKVWSEAQGEPGGFERDSRWATAICERSSGLCGGWIATVVGWQHADPTGDSQRLRGLLLSRGFSVNSIRLGP